MENITAIQQQQQQQQQQQHLTIIDIPSGEFVCSMSATATDAAVSVAVAGSAAASTSASVLSLPSSVYDDTDSCSSVASNNNNNSSNSIDIDIDIDGDGDGDVNACSGTGSGSGSDSGRDDATAIGILQQQQREQQLQLQLLHQQQMQLQKQLQQQLQLQDADAVAIAASAAAAAARATSTGADVYLKVQEHRKSWPFFILLISIIEITIFVYDLLSAGPLAGGNRNPDSLVTIVPTDSVFIYRPDRRLEVWRFVSYMFLHANWFHLGFNVVVQLFYGVPLEVMHGSVRVAIIYFAGVFAGSLGTSVVDSEVYLVGASGGVYALLAAHLANITLNYGQMKYAVAQFLSVVIFVSCDLGYALYTQYLIAGATDGVGVGAGAGELHGNSRAAPPVSYIAHLTGALAGLTIGLLVLKNFEHRSYENLIWWLALGVYSAFTVFAIAFNLINTVTAQLIEEQGEVITQHLMHDLGVS